ncbi:lamin tail domain-containing protein [Candidatus Woesearchaeota archaeon]|nr:lamin tail domain-containing protein [Candidatus Woesearchaeota archaeon]
MIAKAINSITKYILILTLFPVLCLADNAVISQVLYDPAGTETGGEAVELFNPTETDINISGYVIITESSNTDATIPDGTVLTPGSYYLIADNGWSELKDNSSWPDADKEEAITMSNLDAGVALAYPNGTIIDAVGWGNFASIDAGLYEGSPASAVSPGKSLKRNGENLDTDDNSFDFSESTPQWQTSESSTEETSTGEAIVVEVIVSNTPPSVTGIFLDQDDDESAGIQITPQPGESKTITISSEITDPDGTDDIQNVTATLTGPGTQQQITVERVQNISNTTAIYNATIELQFHYAPGEYLVRITANDPAENTTSNTSFNYLSMASISIDATSLQFTGAKLGKTSSITGDFALGTMERPTIKNTGNTPLDIGLYGTDLTSGENNLGITNIKYSFDNDFDSLLSGSMTNILQTKNIGLEKGYDSVIGLGFQIFVPPTTQNGNYTGNITIAAVSSG